jgi:exodeoxyribonuclease V beta subunit
MEFYFPIQKISRETLMMLFKPNVFNKKFENYPEHLEKLTFSPLEGFMKGFIDMVFTHKNRFYIVDWKSNFLGPTRAHYHQQNIAKIMRDHHYILQYHLYALALHCYLRNRIPAYAYQKHFGGIFYLFIRGMESESKNSSGIYFDQPSEQFIEAMREALMPEISAWNVTIAAHEHI